MLDTGLWPALAVAGGITGDRVTATPLAGGQVSLSLASGATRYAELTRTQSGTTDRYLVPAAAGDLVESGVLDLELFNVTGLIRQG